MATSPEAVLPTSSASSGKIYLLIRQRKYADPTGLHIEKQGVGYYTSLNEAVVEWLAHCATYTPHIWKDGKWQYNSRSNATEYTKSMRKNEWYYFIKEVQFGRVKTQGKPVIYSFYNKRLWKYEWTDNDDYECYQLDTKHKGKCQLDPKTQHTRYYHHNAGCFCEPIMELNGDGCLPGTTFRAEILDLDIPEVKAFDWDIVKPVVKVE